MQLFPEVFKIFAPVLLIWGALNTLYAGFLSILQKDIKRMCAYANVSAVGFVMMGLASLNTTGFNGAVFCAIAMAILFCAFFVIISCIVFRTKTANLLELGGIGSVMPKCMCFALSFQKDERVNRSILVVFHFRCLLDPQVGISRGQLDIRTWG